MGLALDVPGLNRIVASVPHGTLLAIEGASDPAKNILCTLLARRSQAEGRNPILLTSKARDAEQDLDVRVGKTIDDIGPMAGDVFIDSFSLMALGALPEQLAESLQSLRSHIRQQGLVAALVLDDGMLGERETAVVRHMADGILKFQARQDDDEEVRFLRIPKWADGTTHAGNIYYEINAGRLLVDTRHRVV